MGEVIHATSVVGKVSPQSWVVAAKKLKLSYRYTAILGPVTHNLSFLPATQTMPRGVPS